MTEEEQNNTEGEETTTTPTLSAEVGYFDGDFKKVRFREGELVSTIINRAGVSFGSGQSVNLEDGTDVSPSSQAVDGEVYFIVGNYKQGKN